MPANCIIQFIFTIKKKVLFSLKFHCFKGQLLLLGSKIQLFFLRLTYMCVLGESVSSIIYVKTSSWDQTKGNSQLLLIFKDI